MTRFMDAKPQITVRLFKTISRSTIDGQKAVSTRYSGRQGADGFIDLTPFLGDNSRVSVTKSVREPAGAFSISFADMAQLEGMINPALESIYGLIEPMDMIEIRMWSGVGSWPKGKPYPIKMRGFVTKISRAQSMSPDGKPQRNVLISGQDYGKIWQTYQLLYLQAYDGAAPYLTAFNLFEKFGVEAKGVMKAADFVRQMVDLVLNKYLSGVVPERSRMPRKILTDKYITVKRGSINNSFQSREGSLYDVVKDYADVGIWNELFLQDLEDGVHVVYRAVPAMHISKPSNGRSLIQDDAVEPQYGDIPDGWISQINVERSDETVANFYWVNNSRYDLIDDIYRKLFAISGDKVTANNYPNASPEFYGVRPMYAETKQAGDNVKSGTGGNPQQPHDARSAEVEAWIDYRRRMMLEINKDNVVLERGSMTVKGGPMRRNGTEALKAGDYIKVMMGATEFTAYVTQITDDFMPNRIYTTNITFERSLGFVERAAKEGGRQSPWLAEQATRK